MRALLYVAHVAFAGFCLYALVARSCSQAIRRVAQNVEPPAGSIVTNIILGYFFVAALAALFGGSR